MAMSTAFVQRTLRENRPLYALMHRFNCQPHIHPDYYSSLPQPVTQLLLNSRRGRGRLAHWVMTQREFDAVGFWDFANPRRRLALLQPSELSELIRYVGTAVHANQIARTIDRNSLTQYRETLGEPLYNFAVKRAPLLIRKMPEGLATPRESNQQIVQWISATGQSCVNFCLRSEPADLRTRMELALPAAEGKELDVEVTEELQESVWNLTKRILLTEIAPQLRSCFN